jgi:hypothetical protein
MSAGSEPHKRLHTLLTDRAIAGLDAKDNAEFEHLRAGAAIDPTYEAAAAAIELALLAQIEPLPESIKNAIIEQAAGHFGFTTPGTKPRATEPTAEPPADVEQDFGEDDFGDELLLGEEGSLIRRSWEQSPRSGLIEDSLETGVLESSLTDGRVDRSASPADSQRNEILPKLERRSKTGAPRPNRRRTDRQPSEPAIAPEPPPPRKKPASIDPADSEGSTIIHVPARESKLARVATYVSAIAALTMLVIAVWLYVTRDDDPDPDAVHDRLQSTDDKIEWTFRAEQDPAAAQAQGSVLWSSELQQGVLMLSGLEVNDPGASQYQLWVVDQQRDGPWVPGAVFDIASAEEVRVAFEPALVIGEPSAFVITIERPGGVVLSKQEHVVLIATR